MGRPVHTTKARIVQDKPPVRRAFLEDFEEPVHFGVHGGIADFYGVPKEKLTEVHPATLDYLVSAVGG